MAPENASQQKAQQRRATVTKMANAIKFWNGLRVLTQEYIMARFFERDHAFRDFLNENSAFANFRQNPIDMHVKMIRIVYFGLKNKRKRNFSATITRYDAFNYSFEEGRHDIFLR